uniref:Uncharacterized protein n=1 Tax=Cacopsylla melanoneura TaxID=428564 RepID=A0A8D8SMF9_9HEMI
MLNKNTSDLFLNSPQPSNLIIDPLAHISDWAKFLDFFPTPSVEKNNQGTKFSKGCICIFSGWPNVVILSNLNFKQLLAVPLSKLDGILLRNESQEEIRGEGGVPKNWDPRKKQYFLYYRIKKVNKNLSEYRELGLKNLGFKIGVRHYPVINNFVFLLF